MYIHRSLEVLKRWPAQLKKREIRCCQIAFAICSPADNNALDKNFVFVERFHVNTTIKQPLLN